MKRTKVKVTAINLSVDEFGEDTGETFEVGTFTNLEDFALWAKNMLGEWYDIEVLK